MFGLGDLVFVVYVQMCIFDLFEKFVIVWKVMESYCDLLVVIFIFEWQMEYFGLLLDCLVFWDLFGGMNFYEYCFVFE